MVCIVNLFECGSLEVEWDDSSVGGLLVDGVFLNELGSLDVVVGMDSSY